MSECSYHVLVSGRVQGVFYRAATQDRANELGVRGWVRNLPDGRVEARVEGDPGAVDDLLAWMRQGPPSAVVDKLEAEPVEPERRQGFDVI